MKKKNLFLINKIFIVLIVCSILSAGLLTYRFSFNDYKYTITVTDKDRINKKEKSKYLVWGDNENGESLVFENTDKLIRFKFNSSNIQGELKVGETYEITVVGVRFSLFSWYENIIKVEKID